MSQYKRLWLVICLSIGILAGLTEVYFNQGFQPILLLIPLVLVFKLRGLLYFLILLVGFNFGSDRGQHFYDDIKTMNNLQTQQIAFSGVITEDLSYHQTGQKEFHVDQINLIEPFQQSINGRIRIRSYEANNLIRGDKVYVSGRLGRALGNRHGSVKFAQIKKLESNQTLIENFRLKFFAATHSVLPDPHSSLGLGFLVGVGNMLPQDLNDNLRTVGLTHIVAVSGYNLTILVVLARQLFINNSKRLAVASAFGLIFVFLLLTGGAPSIVRASIVSGLGLIAWYYGRKVNPLVLLLASAAISAYINPYYLWKDIGWYLSFTAFFGVLVLAPLIVSRVFKKEPKLIGQLLIETTCAQILTFPVIAFIFGDISVVSLLSNLVVLPLVPLAMLVTFASGLLQMAIPSLSSLIAIPARYVLGYIVEITNWLSTWPGAITELNMNLMQMFACYGIIVGFCLILHLGNLKKAT